MARNATLNPAILPYTVVAQSVKRSMANANGIASSKSITMACTRSSIAARSGRYTCCDSAALRAKPASFAAIVVAACACLNAWWARLCNVSRSALVTPLSRNRISRPSLRFHRSFAVLSPKRKPAVNSRGSSPLPFGRGVVKSPRAATPMG